MQRAAVLIGVSSTGDLPKLQAVEAGIAQMRNWAIGQNITGDLLVEITDKAGKVRAYQVAEAIDKLVRRRDLDQLIVYFTGHGLHNESDIWLLSGAPSMAAEAVNVEGSIKAARTCGISHVVLLGDACRTAADSIQALGVKGIDIFPNDPVDGLERPVDVYFACARGKPALEVRDPLQAARGFSGVYTEVLSECLDGKHGGVLELIEQNGITVAQITAWKLADKLLAEVPHRLKARLGKAATVNQTPVARITSRDAWISRLLAAQLLAAPKTEVDVLGALPHSEPNAVEAADLLLGAALAGHSDAAGSGMLGGESPDTGSGGALLMSTAAELVPTFRPNAVEPACGFRLRGARVHAVYAGAVRCAILDAKATRVEVAAAGTPASVLLELDDGRSVLMPAIPGQVTELTFKDGELAHLTYEPSQAGDAASEARRKTERALLASIGASAGLGVLRLTEDAENQMAQRIDGADMLDPALALYMAYTYHERARGARVRLLDERLHCERGFTFYDVALLAGGDRLACAQRDGTVWPCVPMLSRGWSLLTAFGAPRTPLSLQLQDCLRPSMWSLFDAVGTCMLVKAVDDGGFR